MSKNLRWLNKQVKRVLMSDTHWILDKKYNGSLVIYVKKTIEFVLLSCIMTWILF